MILEVGVLFRCSKLKSVNFESLGTLCMVDGCDDGADCQWRCAWWWTSMVSTGLVDERHDRKKVYLLKIHNERFQSLKTSRLKAFLRWQVIYGTGPLSSIVAAKRMRISLKWYCTGHSGGPLYESSAIMDRIQRLCILHNPHLQLPIVAQETKEFDQRDAKGTTICRNCHGAPQPDILAIHGNVWDTSVAIFEKRQFLERKRCLQITSGSQKQPNHWWLVEHCACYQVIPRIHHLRNECSRCLNTFVRVWRW